MQTTTNTNPARTTSRNKARTSAAISAANDLIHRHYTQALRRMLRADFADQHKRLPIIFMAGPAYIPTDVSGDAGHWTTTTGKTLINYPHAYKWPKTYHPSTRHISVTLGYLRDGRRPFMRELISALLDAIQSAEHSMHAAPDSVRDLTVSDSLLVDARKLAQVFPNHPAALDAIDQATSFSARAQLMDAARSGIFRSV